MHRVRHPCEATATEAYQASEELAQESMSILGSALELESVPELEWSFAPGLALELAPVSVPELAQALALELVLESVPELALELVPESAFPVASECW